MNSREPQKHRSIVNRSAPTATVVPVLVYEDVAKAIDWLCGAFGFSERLRAARPDGRVAHAQLSVSEGAVMLGAPGAEFKPPRSDEVNQYVLVHVEDVDGHCEQAKRFGGRIVQPPTDMPFGERVYTAEDLGGHRWTFSQSIADVAPEQWGATEAKPKQ
ncbi:MAG TPA: VOC family protein [Candidatus Dormibacteraeota bacterium]|nr:VOC family protein [Candidatus Dormibacteraeota bacterium]